jgi:hypothetical protein
VRKITSSRGTLFFSRGGQAGLLITHGSISATWPDGVVTENVLWPKYVIRFPWVLSINRLRLEILAGGKAYRICGAKLALFPDASNA